MQTLDVGCIEWHWLTLEQRDIICQWAKPYVDPNSCYRVDLVSDGPFTAARFHLIDRDKYEPGMTTMPSHVEEVMNVAKCPWPFDDSIF